MLHHADRHRSPRAFPHLLLLAVLASLALTLSCVDGARAPRTAGLVTGGPADAAAKPAVAPVTTITWSYWGDDWEAAFNERLVRAFEREHPHIDVRTEHRPWGEYFTWLRAEWAAGRSPDVMFLNYISSYVALGELEPIDRFVRRDDIALDDFYRALLDSFRVDGRLYGLPRDNDTKVIFYNRAHFAAAGIAEPADGWTWDDLRRAAIALTRKDGMAPRYGFGFEPDYWWTLWMWQRGCDVLDHPTRPTRATLDAPACAEALQFLQDLIYRDGVTPPAARLNTDDLRRLFSEGRLAMVFGNHALVPWFAETPGLSWDVAPLPRDAVRTNVAGGAGYVISRRSAHQDAAWELVKFLTGPKAQALLAETGLITPARRSVREDNIFLRMRGYRAGVFLAETERGRPIHNFPGVAEMEQLMDQGLAPVWRGERAPADVLRELAVSVQEIIDRAQPALRVR